MSAAAAFSRKAAISSGLCLIGVQVRGLWVNTWRLSQPRAAPRSMALLIPPEELTWAPNRTRLSYAGAAGAPRDHEPGAGALRAEPDRLAARGKRAHGPLQLADRPPHRRPLRPAPRGHGPRALDARERGGDPAHPRLARARLGRGPVPPERARVGLPGCRRPAQGRRRRLPGVGDHGGARGTARGGPQRPARAGDPRPARLERRRPGPLRGRGAPPRVALRGAPARGDGD